MIETLTIAGPLATLRAQAGPAAGPQIAPDRPIEPLIPPDPTAPAGPRPTFEATPLERLHETRRPGAPRIVEETPAYARLGAPRIAASVDRFA